MISHKARSLFGCTLPYESLAGCRAPSGICPFSLSTVPMGREACSGLTIDLSSLPSLTSLAPWAALSACSSCPQYLVSSLFSGSPGAHTSPPCRPLTEAQPRGRILGGHAVEAHTKPYMASVQVNGTHVCGGFLVNEQWVLSAAHCLEDAGVAVTMAALCPRGKVQVLLGAHSLSLPKPSKSLYDVRRAVPHPYSRPDTIEHDLLLLQLSENVTLSPNVSALLWQPHEDRDVAPGTLCDVAGWGVVSHTGRRPDLLQHVSLPVLDRATCNLRTFHDGVITQRTTCAESNRRDRPRREAGPRNGAGTYLKGGTQGPGL
ncbi:complement factor D [Rhynchocyon petersi]